MKSRAGSTGWVSANVDLAAVAEPRDRWRPHSSNPPMRRRALRPSSPTSANRRLMEPRETGLPVTSHTNAPDQSATDDGDLTRPVAFIEVNITDGWRGRPGGRGLVRVTSSPLVGRRHLRKPPGAISGNPRSVGTAPRMATSSPDRSVAGCRSTSDQAINRQRARTTQDKGRKAGEIQKVTFVADRP